jgi:class 3 adenylate cyclase
LQAVATYPVTAGFWDRLAARTKPAGYLTAFESRMTVARVFTLSLALALVFSMGTAGWLFAAGETAAGWDTVVLVVGLAVAWTWYAVTGSVFTASVIGLVVSLANQVLVHVALGGFAYSGAVLMWGIAGTILIALPWGRRLTVGVVVVYIVLAVTMGILEPILAASRSAPRQMVTSTMFVGVMVGNILVLTPVVWYLLGRLSFERERSERLLLNMLPEEVAVELKETGRAEARRFESISVLFADAVGFTARSERIPADQVVAELDEVFSYFDELTEKHGCEKIRTIGDAYMVAAGVPVPRADHARVLAAMGLEILEYCRDRGLAFRVGISSGPVVAGVIGRSKYQYDVWGDTVNTASRMESHGEPGRIQVSEPTYRLIADSFTCVARGKIEVKGKGVVDTWFVEAAIPDP